jgi:hypothetical protein
MVQDITRRYANMPIQIFNTPSLRVPNAFGEHQGTVQGKTEMWIKETLAIWWQKRVQLFQWILCLSISGQEIRTGPINSLGRKERKRGASNDRDLDHSFNQHDKKSTKSGALHSLSCHYRNRKLQEKMLCWIRTNVDKQKMP